MDLKTLCQEGATFIRRLRSENDARDLTLAFEQLEKYEKNGLLRFGRSFTYGLVWKEEYSFDGNNLILSKLHFKIREPKYRTIIELAAPKENIFTENECSICYEKAEMLTECAHAFCFLCFSHYIYSTMYHSIFSCPMCRKESNVWKIFTTRLNHNLLVKWHPEAATFVYLDKEFYTNGWTKLRE